jgi:hypothetical protein
MDRIKQNIFLDDRLASYRKLFSDDWAHRLHKFIDGAPKLRCLGFDLLMQWRGAAYTAEFPATLIDHFSNFAAGFIREPTPNTDIIELATAPIARCSREIPELNIDPSVQNKLRKLFIEIGAQLTDFGQNRTYEFPREEIWKRYLQEPVYQITLWSSLWSSLRICYAAIFNAYDNFLARCTQVAAADTDIKTTDRDFNKRFSAAFGEPMLRQCWHTKDMHIIRRARHSLSHAGGRDTEPLQKLNHSIRVEAGKLQITPDDLGHEYETLKTNVLSFAEHAHEWPQFQ